MNEIQWAFCVTCECDTARYAPKGRKTGKCKACLAKRDARPEVKAKKAAYDALPEVKAKKAERNARPEVKARIATYQAKRNAEAKAERNAYRNILLLSLGVTDLSQDYEFHHVVSKKVTGHKAIGTLLLHKPTWEQAWAEAHSLCVVWEKAYHKQFHKTHEMQEDGTFTVRPGVQTPIT